MPIIDCFGQLGPQPYPTLATTPDVFDRLMKKFGIDLTFVVATEALRGSMKDGNEWLAAQIAGRENFRGYCVVNPLMLEASQEEMRKYLFKPTFMGALLHEGYVNRPLNSEAMRQLLKSLLRFDRPLLLHISNPREMNDLQEIAREFPTQRFIILHMAEKYWPMALSLAAKVTNIYLETGGVEADFDKFSEAIQALGAHRLLFGSGMPLVNPVYALGMIRDSAIPAIEKERIMIRNAKKVFNIE